MSISFQNGNISTGRLRLDATRVSNPATYSGAQPAHQQESRGWFTRLREIICRSLVNRYRRKFEQRVTPPEAPATRPLNMSRSSRFSLREAVLSSPVGVRNGVTSTPDAKGLG